jgi:hypothetical protein
VSVKATARHSAATPRWGTPDTILGKARELFEGEIDLDPCTELAFQAAVRARIFYTPELDQDGLRLSWFGNVLCNPPGGLVREFWLKLMSERLRAPSIRCLWVGFSVEQLCLLAGEPQHPLDFPTCILRQRIRFTRHDGYSGSPSHGNYVTGVGIDQDVFARVFDGMGILASSDSSRRGPPSRDLRESVPATGERLPSDAERGLPREEES